MFRSDLPDFLTVQDLAQLLRVSDETIARKARAGVYPTVPGLRVHRFPRDLILAAIMPQATDRKTETSDD